MWHSTFSIFLIFLSSEEFIIVMPSYTHVIEIILDEKKKRKTVQWYRINIFVVKSWILVLLYYFLLCRFSVFEDILFSWIVNLKNNYLYVYYLTFVYYFLFVFFVFFNCYSVANVMYDVFFNINTMLFFASRHYYRVSRLSFLKKFHLKFCYIHFLRCYTLSNVTYFWKTE